MFLSTFFFALANVFVKGVSHLPAMEIVFFRCVIGVAICLVGLRSAGADWIGSDRLRLFLRGLFGTAALFSFFVTLQHVPLASAVTIQYLSPIFTTLIAIFILHEAVRLPQWLFFAIAFGGVLLIEQFDARISLPYLILGIVSAFCSGVAYNLVRSMRGTEHPLTIVLHFQLFGAVAGLISLMFARVMPQGIDWLFLALIGICSQLGQVFLTRALQKEAVAGVVIVNYTGLIYALVIGLLAFGETYTLATIGGMLLVVFGVVLSILYGRRMKENAEVVHASEA